MDPSCRSPVISTRRNTSGNVTCLGSPLPRNQSEENRSQAEQQSFGRRVTRHGKEY
jgi:hypothetical protein